MASEAFLLNLTFDSFYVDTREKGLMDPTILGPL